ETETETERQRQTERQRATEREKFTYNSSIMIPENYKKKSHVHFKAWSSLGFDFLACFPFVVF
ncbi:hypothetical protein ACQP3C_27740, partial [Escherichia coli]